MRHNFSLFGTAAIVCFIAVVIAMLIAGAVEEATKPQPGWTPSNGPTVSTR